MEFIFECARSGLGSQEKERFPVNTHNVHFSPAMEQKFRIPEVNPSDMIVIILSLELYFRLIPKNSGLLNKFSDSIKLGKSCSLFDSYVTFTTWIQSVLNDIDKCNYVGELKRLYLENKIQELLLLHFDLYQQYHLNSQAQKISDENFEKLKEAKSILDTNYVNAPSLKELSKQIYLNEYALKKEFKICFGTTIKQYVISLRMKYAMDLIKEGEHSITDIAHKCGYKGLVQFSTAFKKFYGKPPTSLSRLI
ncbi:helix-turn-helix domain-containing protein [Gelidibacter maritimus]|uniref:Helix-turn-helix transcriptional regulator n=1 Tax=Gelidibacter maritimus TaxID=2761487 RepID=A0A7W2M5L6_9FLAO|nr:AraC family transcriptional regulator [Gelidibacter maritimus]MBA6153123.1 helix-turn-helix transcriptional regulator [Gelidibacter maritimus]